VVEVLDALWDVEREFAKRRADPVPTGLEIVDPSFEVSPIRAGIDLARAGQIDRTPDQVAIDINDRRYFLTVWITSRPPDLGEPSLGSVDLLAPSARCVAVQRPGLQRRSPSREANTARKRRNTSMRLSSELTAAGFVRF
jgi:hypothetical protein